MRTLLRRRHGITTVSLTFDDGWACQYEHARPILAAHGMRGTFFVNSSLVGAADRVTWSELETMANEGHEIGGHSLEHPDLTSLEPEEARRQIGDDRAALLQRGFAPRSFAYPGGAYDSSVARIVRQCGYASARAAWGLRKLEQPHGDRRPLSERIPPSDPYAILTPCCLWSTTPVKTLTRYVERAERSGGWVPLVLHRICDDCDAERPAPSMTPSSFSTFLDWLEARATAGTIVRTVAAVVAPEGGT